VVGTVVDGAREEAMRIAATVRANKSDLLARWIELARSDTEGVPRAKDLPRHELVDYVPGLVDKLCEELEAIDPKADVATTARGSGAAAAAIVHAEHRFAQGYSIGEVVRELAHFRVAILEICGRAGTPLDGPGGRVVHALIDQAVGGGVATIEKRERERNESDRQRAEDLQRAKDDFVSRASHELRTPLNVILGWTKLTRGRSDLPPAVASALETIERNAALQARLIDDLLDLARIRHEKLTLELRSLDPLEAVRSSIESTSPLAAAKQIEIATDLPAGQTWMLGDFDRLHQVFTNLLSNAVKFTPARGRITVRARMNGGRLRIAIEDTGVGIPAELIPHLFNAFRQGDPSAGKRSSGLGLGLAIVRELVELHGGRAFAESQGMGLGSTFVVELPATAEAASAA
jgi:signal transduction histidine kinase